MNEKAATSPCRQTTPETDGRVELLKCGEGGRLVSYVIRHKKRPKYFEPRTGPTEITRCSLTAQSSEEICEQKKKTLKQVKTSG